MNVQLENSRLAYEVRRLQNENAKLRGKSTAPGVDAATQANRPIASSLVGGTTLAGWAAPPPGFGSTPPEANDSGEPAAKVVTVKMPPR